MRRIAAIALTLALALLAAPIARADVISVPNEEFFDLMGGGMILMLLLVLILAVATGIIVLLVNRKNRKR